MRGLGIGLLADVPEESGTGLKLLRAGLALYVMDACNRFYEYRPAAHFLVRDEDAADFLQSQFSNELRPFEAGRCTYGLWLDVKGRVIADSVVLCEGDASFRVLSERCQGERIAAHMERHIIADDVAIEHCEPGCVVELSAEGMRALGLGLPETGRFTRIENGILLTTRNDVYRMLIDSGSAREAWLEKLAASGLQAASEAEHALRRIAAGMPLVPEEIGVADLPGEGELEHDAISFTKGCYLGQEVVARMHNIGKPQRRLFVVEGQGPLPDVPLALYNSDGKPVGELRSAYLDADGWTGVAILKTRFADVGSKLCHQTIQSVVIRPLRGGLENV